MATGKNIDAEYKAIVGDTAKGKETIIEQQHIHAHKGEALKGKEERNLTEEERLRAAETTGTLEPRKQGFLDKLSHMFVHTSSILFGSLSMNSYVCDRAEILTLTP